VERWTSRRRPGSGVGVAGQVVTATAAAKLKARWVWRRCYAERCFLSGVGGGRVRASLVAMAVVVTVRLLVAETFNPSR